jgi:hypothetical protein
VSGTPQPAEPVKHGMVEYPRIRDVGLVAWVYYTLDLYGPDGTPSNSKVLVSWGFFVALAAELWWGFYLTRPDCFISEGVRTCTDAPGITSPYVWLVVMTLTVAMGKDVVKAALKMRYGGKPEDS